jgi:hypothetical protein
MEEWLARAWDQLVGRAIGPMHLRFILQPTMAAILAVRAGWREAECRSLLRSAWHDVGTLALVAFLLDLVYEVVILHSFRPRQALVVATLLAVVPYILIRGVIGWLARAQRERA